MFAVVGLRSTEVSPGREEVPRHRRVGRADAAGLTDPDGMDVEPVEARREPGRLDGHPRSPIGLGQCHRADLPASRVDQTRGQLPRVGRGRLGRGRLLTGRFPGRLVSARTAGREEGDRAG